jgi:hypothetical protein
MFFHGNLGERGPVTAMANSADSHDQSIGQETAYSCTPSRECKCKLWKIILLFALTVPIHCIYLIFSRQLHHRKDYLFMLGKLCPLLLQPQMVLLYQPQGKPEESKKPALLPLCPQQMPHGLPWHWNRASAVGSRSLFTTELCVTRLRV